MRQILDEYGEAIIGAVAVVAIISIALFLFKSGGMIEDFYTSIANSAI